MGPRTTEDEALLARAEAWAGSDNDVPDTAALDEIARREGLEFATAVWYSRVIRAPANAAFLKSAGAAMDSRPPAPELIGIVPGAFHREHRGTGADGARIVRVARSLGCAAEVIPLPGFGRLADNARVIREWLAARRGRRVTLVSLSKGGADVRAALASPDAAEVFAGVCAWVSLSGIVRGTALVEWLRARPLRWWAVRAHLWWRGHPRGALDELARRSEASIAPWPALPPGLRVVHVYGVPLERHLAHPWAGKAHRRLSGLGPNDGGGVLLGDVGHLPGVVCPVWGADHYLAPAWGIEPLLGGILTAAATSLQASRSASAPSTAPATRSSV